MNGCMYRWIDGWMKEWMGNEWMDGWKVNEWIDG